MPVKKTPTDRQVKINHTLWLEALRKYGGSSPQAYLAYQRFLRVQEERDKAIAENNTGL